jgi:hypothetical protein
MIFIDGWDIKFNFFYNFFDVSTKKDQIFIQTIKIVFKRLYLNLNGPIRRRHLTTAHWLQRWAVVRAVAPGLAPTQALPPALAR